MDTLIKTLLEYRDSNIPRKRLIYIKSIKYFNNIVKGLSGGTAEMTSDLLEETIKNYKIYPKLNELTKRSVNKGTAIKGLFGPEG